MSDFEYDNNNTGAFGNISQGGFNTEHAGSSQRQTTTQVRQSLTPVTIKQINDATQPVPDGEFKVNNVELNMISFVGVVRNVENTNASIAVTIEDGTGSIDVRKWVDETISSAEEDFEKYNEMKGKYVYVGGSLKQFNNRKTVQNASISLITDSNQIVYHHLSAIEHHLKAQGITVADAASAGAGQATNSTAVLKEASRTMPDGVPVDYVAEKLSITKEESQFQLLKLNDEGKAYAGYDDNSYLVI